METIEIIAKITALIITLLSLPKILHSISELRRKKFKDELENFTEYFQKYYNSDADKLPQLLRDKAAQNVTRNIEMNTDLLHHLIKLHESNIANFDKTTDQFFWGSRFIKITKTEFGLRFSSQRQLSTTLSIINYILYAILIIFAVFFFLGIINFFNIRWFNLFIGIALIISAISCLRTAEDMKEALRFLRNME